MGMGQGICQMDPRLQIRISGNKRIVRCRKMQQAKVPVLLLLVQGL